MLSPLPNHPHGSIDPLLNADGKIINSGAKKRQKSLIAISALPLERSRMFIPYDVVDGAEHLPSGTKEDVRQHLLKLNIFHIIWPGYLCVLKEPAEMLGEVLCLQSWGNSKGMGGCQGSSGTAQASKGHSGEQSAG